MASIETVSATESYRCRNEDRFAVLDFVDRTVIVVADGAGGIGSGDEAAETVLRDIESEASRIHSADEWSSLLKQIDTRIGVGESTAVVVDVRPYGIAGSSVGDSQAWIIRDGKIIELTNHQNRKPLLGSGLAHPVSFSHQSLEGCLLVGTDGFFNYAKRDLLAPLVSRSDFYSIPRLCIELVRLPSGDLWDDITVIAARPTPRQTIRKQYSV